MRDMHVAIGSKEASIHIAMHIRRHHRVVESCVKITASPAAFGIRASRCGRNECWSDAKMNQEDGS